MQDLKNHPKAMLNRVKRNNAVKRRKTQFSLNMPKARKAILMGDFNMWSPEINPMQKDENGVWRTSVMLYPGRYEYRFQVDGEWYNDPNNYRKCPNCFGTKNNVIDIGK